MANGRSGDLIMMMFDGWYNGVMMTIVFVQRQKNEYAKGQSETDKT